MEVRTFWCLLYEKKAEPVKGSAFFCIMYGDGGSRTHVQKHRLLKRLRA